jgi:translation elongation factor EF-G
MLTEDWNLDQEELEEILGRIREQFVDSLLSFEEVLLNLSQLESKFEQGIIEDGLNVVVRGEEHNQELLPLVTLVERYADDFIEEIRLILDCLEE